MRLLPRRRRRPIRVSRGVALAAALLAGCVSTGNGSGQSSRPGVMPMLSELPGDPVKRDAVLDSANATPGPEHRKPVTPKQHKAETAAATAAAILGGMFSKTQNVTLGTRTSFEENLIVEPQPQPVRPRSQPEDSEAAGEIAQDGDAPLVPWIKLD